MEYKKEAYEMFEDLMRDIQATFTDRYLKIQVSAEPPRQPPPPPITPRSGTDELFSGAARTSTGPMGRPPPRVDTSMGRLGPSSGGLPIVGRNDPCPCGSGKKYKKFHGAGA